MAVPIPPLNLNLNQASSADGRSQSAFDSSGWNVSIGGKGNGTPAGWIVAALAIGAVLWIARKKA
jgi:hypothetical protein